MKREVADNGPEALDYGQTTLAVSTTVHGPKKRQVDQKRDRYAFGRLTLFECVPVPFLCF